MSTASAVRPLVLAAALVAALPAQLPEWSSPPSSTFNQFLIEHTVIGTVFGNTVQCFSSITKTWTVVTTTVANPTVRLHNEHLIIQDGTTFIGYSSRTGTVSSVSTTSGSLILTPPQTWQSLVLDGGFVHVFFPLYGTWTTVPTSAPATAFVGRQAAVFSDGVECFGVSPTRGTVVPLGLPATATFSEGSVGFALSSGVLHGFSGHTGAWFAQALSTPAPSISSGPSYNGFAAAVDGTSVHFFSGYRGGFVTAPFPGGASLSISRQVAAVVVGNTAHVYSGPQGVLVSTTFASPPTVDLRDFFGLFTDTAGVTAFSAPRGAFAPALAGSYTTANDQGMSAATPVGATVPTHVYSAHLNQWLSVPGIPAATTYVTGQAVVLYEPGVGLHALSSRGGAWKFQAAATLDFVKSHTSIWTGRSGLDLHAFNYRTRRWVSQTLSGVPQHWAAHFDTCIVTDPAGGMAYGYSHHLDAWVGRILTGTPIIAAVEITTGYVNDSGGTHAFGGAGQLTDTAEWPDFWRMAVRGGMLQVEIAGEPFADAILAAAAAPAHIDLSPYGVLRLDPATLVIIDTPFLNATGTYQLRIDLPDVPWLAGAVFHLQAVIGGPFGPYFTNAIETTVL
jgi:hypothetical protein